MTTLRQDRLADVDRRLADAERHAGQRHAEFATAVGRSMHRLRDRLGQVHERCDSIHDRDWAEYVTDLDRGLDELHLELARAAEQGGSAATIEDVLRARTADLEMRGWRIRIDTLKASPGELANVRSLVVVAETELDRYRAAIESGASASADPVEESMEDLRRGVGQAEAAA